VASIGERPSMEARVDQLRRMTGSEHEDIAAHMSALAASPNQARRYFAVGLRDNKVRVVFPDENDPLRYREQITADELWGISSLAG
jgi:hypothetical protein